MHVRDNTGAISRVVHENNPETPTATRPRSAFRRSSPSVQRLFMLVALSSLAVAAGIACGACEAFAGGAGSAESELLFVNDKYMTVQVETDPPILEADTESVRVSIAIMDVDAEPPEPVSEASYSLKFKDGVGGKTLFEVDVHSPAESSALEIIPDADGDIQITGDADANGVLLASPDSPPVIRAPLFLEGGTTEMSITLKSIGTEPVDAQNPEFEIAVSMGEFIPFSVDMDGMQTELVFATYFDRIEEFSYDERRESITAVMPFEWNEDVIDSIPFVHAEYYIPKTVGVFEDHEILLAVNGITYFGTVDRSGDDEIVVHFLISSSKLREMLAQVPRDELHVMTFEIQPGKARQKINDDASLEAGDTITVLSSQEDWRFFVSLTPGGAVVPGQDVWLNIEFRDPATNTIIPQITYDVDVLIDGQTAYSERRRDTPDGRDQIRLNFGKAGAVIVQLANINEFATSGEFAFHVREPQAAAPAEPDHVIEMAQGSFLVGCERDNACFEPFGLDVRPGQTVSWINLDEQGHTVASGTPSEGGDGVFESPVVGKGMAYTHTFDTPGQFDYFCTLHPWMVGTITVSEDAEGGRDGSGADSTAEIPDWVRSNAQWWVEGLIDDATFVTALEHLIREQIILLPADAAGAPHAIPDAGPSPNRESTVIPGWVRSNAQWWAEGLIDDATFVGSIEWMISNGVIVIAPV